MKYLLSLFLLCAAMPAAAQGLIPCTQWSFIHDAGATPATQFATAAGTTRQIGICGYMLVASGNAATFQLVYGTGTNCANGQTPLSPIIAISNSTSLVNRNPYIVENTPAGQGLCVIITGLGTIDATVYWTTF